MTETALQGIRACVFDAYGTLFDYASAAAGCRDVLGDKLAPLVALWREKQLQCAWLRSLLGAHADFWQVTGDGLDFALETLGIASPELRTRLMNLYLALELFPDVPEMMQRVKAAGLKTAILSNGAPAMLAAAVEHAKIGPYLDGVLSIEDASIYKPHPKAYQVAVDRLGLPAASLVFLSSNGWDAYGAARFGMRVVWCNRYGQRPERLPGKPDREIKTLAELPALLGA